MWLQFLKPYNGFVIKFLHFQFASETSARLHLITNPCLVPLQIIVLHKVSGFAVLVIFDARVEGILV